MADKKISELTAGGPAQAGDELPVARSGSNVKLTADEIASLPIAQQVLTGGTVTANAPVLTATQTWNNAAVTFDALKLNVTDTASAAASRLLDLQVGGTSRFNVTKAGLVTAQGLLPTGTVNTGIGSSANGRIDFFIFGSSVFSVNAGSAATTIRGDKPLTWDSGTVNLNYSISVALFRDADDTLAQRRTTNAQTFRLYNTFTDASNYERGRFAWASNVLTIGTENAGTGSARNVEIQTSGTTRLTLSSTAATFAVPVVAPNLAMGRSFAVFTPLDNQPPAANFATLDTRNSVAVLDFDAATDESAVFVGVIPEGATTTSGLKVVISWAATSATSGDCVWLAAFEKTTGHDIDADGFDTATSVTTTTSGTSGVVNTTTITCTTIDSLVAGDCYRLKLTRDADAGADTMTGDAELVAVEVQQVA